jgi:hypothetical protein
MWRPEPPPATSMLRLVQSVFCQAPQYSADELWRSEGFDELRYVPSPAASPVQLAAAEAGITLIFGGPLIL